MTELASLQIRVDSRQVGNAEKGVDRLSRSGARAERATDRLSSSFRRIAGPAAALAAAIAGINKLTSVTREFDVLNAQLLTATGSAKGAAQAFEAIQDFATKTPYDLQQVTEGFVKLVNLGLTPSERALTSYGDTASAMGKSLNQMIEAVADAATGEFERLKEFGIKASAEGDKVSFTFRGVTTTVRKNAAEIEQYLLTLGETEFAGAMINRVNSLDGALSNLSDEYNKLFLNISQKGIGDRIEASVRVAISALEELNAQLASGELDAYIEAIGIKFDGVGSDIAYTVDAISDIIDEAGELWAESGASAIVDISGAFSNLPENVRAVVKIMAIEFAALVDYGALYGSSFKNAVVLEFDRLVDIAGVYATRIKEAFTPFSPKEFDLDAELEKVQSGYAERERLATESVREREEAIAELRLEMIDGILQERDAYIASADAQISKAKSLREEYEKTIAARDASAGDRLEEFKTGKAESGPSKEEAKRLAKEKKDRERALDSLEDYLLTEEELIEKSHARRRQIILDNTEAGSKQQEDLLRRLTEKTADELENLHEKTTSIADQAARNIQDAFADFLFDPFSEGLDGMLMGFVQIIQRMAAEAVAADLLHAIGLGGKDNKGGNAAAFGGAVASLLSFDGGGYTGDAPRSGGIDGKGGYLAVMHPKETVIDHTKAQSSQPSQGAQSPPNVFVSIDPQAMVDFIATSKGRQNIVETIRLEADTIKAILG